MIGTVDGILGFGMSKTMRGSVSAEMIIGLVCC